MGITKTELYDDSLVQLANQIKALGHPARLAIIKHLLSIKQCITGDIVEAVGLSQPSISQHLKALKEAGLLCGTVEGTSVNYCIDTKQWNKLGSEIGNLFEKQSGVPDCNDNDCC